MVELNLIAKGSEQEILKKYLEENASEMLAEKINNGVIIEKDGKKLINVKTLDGFMNYAAEEAKKLSEKGAKFACIESKTVFGWAIHYFEEENIEEKLYLEDGTEYKPTPKYTPNVIETKKTEPKKKQPEYNNGQQSMFDLFAFDETPSDAVAEPENIDSVEDPPAITSTKTFIKENDDKPGIVEKDETEIHEEKSVSPLYKIFREYQDSFGDNTIILMRIGDFYEIFGEWAVTLSKRLELTLVGRDLGLSERTPMIGIPYHKLEIYLPKLTKIAPVAIYQKDEPAELHPMTSSIDYSNVDKETGEVLDVKLKPETEECLRIIRAIFKDELEVSL